MKSTLVIYRDDIICKTVGEGLLPIEWAREDHKYGHWEEYGFKEYGMMRYCLSNYRSEDLREGITYNFCEMVLFWDFDSNEHNAAKLRADNLYLVKDTIPFDVIWTMKEVVNWKDTCTGVDIVSPDSFYFTTFACVGFTMKWIDGKLVCEKKVFTR